jgi:phosphate transport system permease protein
VQGTGVAVARPPREVARTTRAKAPREIGDSVFHGIARTSGISVLATMALVGIFLGVRAAQALHQAGWSFLTTQRWEPDAGTFGIAAVLVGTVLVGAVAVLVALPLATASALYLSEYAPRRLRKTLIGLVDLMAAVPSVIYGLWGFFFLQSRMVGVARWIATYFGWIPIFKVDGADPRDPLSTASVYTSSTFIAGIVVALMITPLICAVMREAFAQAPAGEREGAYALGATRWGMIRTVVLPFGKAGMIGGTMLGLGRALGETIAVYMILSVVLGIQVHVLQSGGSTVSSLIALRYGEATKLGVSALMAAGLALFVLTLAVNFAASAVIARSRSGAASEV